MARLHRSPAYLERRAVLASRSATSGALEGLSRCYPVLSDDKRSQADIPGTHEVGMEGALTVLAHKEQAVLGTVLPARVATARTGLMAPVRIHADAATARQGRFVGQQFPQFGKGPLGGMPVRASGLWGKLGPVACRGARRLRRFVCSRMPVKSSRPIRLWGWVSRICLAMVWLVLSLNRLVCLAHGDASPGGRPRAFAAPAVVGHARSGQLWLSPARLG